MASNAYSDVFTLMFNEIKKTQKAGALSATIIMIYVCIDTMALLNMPLNKAQQDKDDFMNWVLNYLKADVRQEYQYDASDVYAARCGQLHSYSPLSNFGINRKCKRFGYHNGTEHRFQPDIDSGLVLISIGRLVEDFMLE